MRGLFLLIAAFACVYSVDAQSPDWAWARQTVSGDQPLNNFLSTAMDGEGNTLVTGYFGGTMDLLGTVFTTGSINDVDVVVAKFAPDGALIWARQGGATSTGEWDMGKRVACDDQGNVYVVGSHGPPPVVFEGVELSTSASGSFLVKYDPDGALVYASEVNDGSVAGCLTVDTLGIVDVVGVLDGDLFWKRFDQTGIATDVWTLPGSWPNRDVRFARTTDGGMAIAVMSYVDLDADPGPDTVLVQPHWSGNGVLLKYDTLGAFVSSAIAYGIHGANINDLEPIADGGLMICGEVHPPATLGGMPLADGFIARLDALLGVEWVGALVEEDTVQGTVWPLIPFFVDGDTAGGIYVAGRVILPSVPGVSEYTISGEPVPEEPSIFVAKMDTTGGVAWVTLPTSPAFMAPNFGFGAGGIDVVSVCGVMSDTAVFGSHTLSTSNPLASFVARLGESSIGLAEPPPQTIRMFPNPCDRYLILDSDLKNISIVDVAGRSVHLDSAKASIDTGPLSPGLYILTGRSHGKGVQGRFMVCH